MPQATDKTLTQGLEGLKKLEGLEVPTKNQYGEASKKAYLRHIRLKKEESAFVYAVLEASEGIVAYSTLDAEVGQLYRDLELQIPAGMLEEAQRTLDSLGDLVYDLGWTDKIYDFDFKSRLE